MPWLRRARRGAGAAFNNVQCSAVNTGAVFDATGRQTNAAFGQYTAARPSRRIVFTRRALF